VDVGSAVAAVVANEQAPALVQPSERRSTHPALASQPTTTPSCCPPCSTRCRRCGIGPDVPAEPCSFRRPAMSGSIPRARTRRRVEQVRNQAVAPRRRRSGDGARSPGRPLSTGMGPTFSPLFGLDLAYVGGRPGQAETPTGVELRQKQTRAELPTPEPSCRHADAVSGAILQPNRQVLPRRSPCAGQKESQRAPGDHRAPCVPDSRSDALSSAEATAPTDHPRPKATGASASPSLDDGADDVALRERFLH